MAATGVPQRGGGEHMAGAKEAPQTTQLGGLLRKAYSAGRCWVGGRAKDAREVSGSLTIMVHSFLSRVLTHSSTTLSSDPSLCISPPTAGGITTTSAMLAQRVALPA